MVEQTVSLGEVDNVDPDSVHKIIRVLHPEVEPLQIPIAICVVAHKNVESCSVLQPHLVEVGALKVSVKGDRRLQISVKGHLLAGSVCHMSCLGCGTGLCFKVGCRISNVFVKSAVSS